MKNEKNQEAEQSYAKETNLTTELNLHLVY